MAEPNLPGSAKSINGQMKNEGNMENNLSKTDLGGRKPREIPDKDDEIATIRARFAKVELEKNKQIKQLIEASAGNHKNISALEREIKKKEAEIKSMNGHLQKYVDNEKEFKEKLKTMRKEREHDKKKLADSVKILGSLHSEIAEYEIQVSLLQREIKEMGKDLEDKNGQIMLLKASANSLMPKERNERLSGQNSALIQTVEALERQISSLTDQFQNTQRDVRSLVDEGQLQMLARPTPAKAVVDCRASLGAASVDKGFHFDQGVQKSCSQGTNENLLKKLADATCLVKAGEFNATGFHFMEGWTMTVGHSFQDDDKDPDYCHSHLANARFIFDIDGEKTEFGPQQNRMAFIHHLKAGEDVDTENMDIALVKLGRQYRNDNRTVYKKWENEEQNKLNQVNLMGFGEVVKGKVSVGDKVRVIFYQYDDIASDYKRKIEERTVKSVTPPKKSDGFPFITLEPAIEHAAVSGSPVVVIKDHMFVGLLYSGDPKENDVLMWDGGIEKYMEYGEEIIRNSNKCMALKNELQKVKETLEKLAKDGKLTIYLVDGETFNGQN